MCQNACTRLIYFEHVPIAKKISSLERLSKCLTRVVGVHAGPAKRDSRDGVIKVPDGLAVGRQLQLVVALVFQRLKEVLVALVDAPQAVRQVLVIDPVESQLEILITSHLHVARGVSTSPAGIYPCLQETQEGCS